MKGVIIAGLAVAVVVGVLEAAPEKQCSELVSVKKRDRQEQSKLRDPMHNEKKFQEIKSGKVNPRTADADLKDGERTEKVDGYTWTYRVEDGGATIVAGGGEAQMYNYA